MFICHYSSFYPLSFNQAGNRLPEPCTSPSCWSFIETFLSNHFSHTETTHTHSLTHTFLWGVSANDSVWLHTDMIDCYALQSNRSNVSTLSHLFLFHVLSGLQVQALCSPLWTWMLPPCRNYTPPNTPVTLQFTGAAGIWGPRPKPFIWGFEKTTSLLSSNALGDNGLETHREGKWLSHWLRAGAAASDTQRGGF